MSVPGRKLGDLVETMPAIAKMEMAGSLLVRAVEHHGKQEHFNRAGQRSRQSLGAAVTGFGPRSGIQEHPRFAWLRIGRLYGNARSSASSAARSDNGWKLRRCTGDLQKNAFQFKKILSIKR